MLTWILFILSWTSFLVGLRIQLYWNESLELFEQDQPSWSSEYLRLTEWRR